ncbi:hypothetical protein HO133_005535 [Letharia lupina]|uniref:Uncharacterized protein n=1 Tax=Letharia lupina TaxID=560253 RepID=A0A8H6F8L0_9LECA|nr:uncharacterized protein HO133_005535 [Letharia lupina]KAF6218991.1 hypothetical protein HO133_005535 [Letharia lupina]
MRQFDPRITSISFCGKKFARNQVMDTPTSASNIDTWRPSWEREPQINDLLRPYSTAAVVYDGNRLRPELWDICNGCILWLPPKADISNYLDSSLSDQDPGFFNHPILVLNIDITGPRNATVQFATMTRLGNRFRERMDASQWDAYIPVSPASPHPNSGLLLRLENEKPKRGMVDNCYVSIREGVSSLDYRALRCYSAAQKADGYRHRLKEESFDQVMRELGRSPSAWIETAALWEEFLQKRVPAQTEKAFDG